VVQWFLANLRLQSLLKESAAEIIHSFLKRTQISRNVILMRNSAESIQKNFRQFSAKKQFKLLKVEARSISHYKSISNQLESKVVQLSVQLAKYEKSNRELKLINEELIEERKKIASLIQKQLKETDDPRNELQLNQTESAFKCSDELIKTASLDSAAFDSKKLYPFLEQFLIHMADEKRSLKKSSEMKSDSQQQEIQDLKVQMQEMQRENEESQFKIASLNENSRNSCGKMQKAPQPSSTFTSTAADATTKLDQKAKSHCDLPLLIIDQIGMANDLQSDRKSLEEAALFSVNGKYSPEEKKEIVPSERAIRVYSFLMNPAWKSEFLLFAASVKPPRKISPDFSSVNKRQILYPANLICLRLFQLVSLKLFEQVFEDLSILVGSLKSILNVEIFY
jgi:myosin heavy subunit